MGCVFVPLLVCRLTMLAWALWLAASLVSWLRWAFRCFATGGLWKSWPAPADAGKSPPPLP